MNTITGDHNIAGVGGAILCEDLHTIGRVINPNNLLSMPCVDLRFVFEVVVEQLNQSLPGKEADTMTKSRRRVRFRESRLDNEAGLAYRCSRSVPAGGPATSLPDGSRMFTVLRGWTRERRS